MSAEIIAKLGLDDAKFDRGLAGAESKFSKFTSRLRTKDVTTPGNSSVDMALRASERRVQQVETRQNKLKLARQPEIEQSRESTVDAALRVQEAQRRIAAQAAKQGPLVPLLPSPQEVDQKATGILGMLRKKFSAANLFKDTLRAFGLGLGVGAIASAVTTFFANAAERAKSLATLTESLRENTDRWLGALGGPTRELELQVKLVNALNRDIATQRELVKDLRANPLNLVGEGAEQVKAAEEELNRLILKQADLSTGAQMVALADKRRVEALQRQMVHASNLANIELRHGVEGMKFDEKRRAMQVEYNELRKQGALPSTLQENLNRQKALEKEREIFNRNQREKIEDLQRTAQFDREITAAELRHAGEVEKKQIRLNALRRDEQVLKKRTGPLSLEVAANRNEQLRLQNDIRGDQRNAGQQLATETAGAGQLLVSGRPILRSRGRSERERIADRAAATQARAEEAVRTGRSPAFIASLAQSAASDFRKVGAKSGESTSEISKADANALGSPLLKTNQILEEIRKNLTPTKLK